jgi:hypothetical protein
VEIKDPRQTLAITTGYWEMNAWLEWIKYFACTLNKLNCYTCVTGRPEPQVVPFPLGWTIDLAGMACMIALFKERTAWGNGSCRTLSLLFPTINDHERLNHLSQLDPHLEALTLPLDSLGGGKG